LATLTVGTAIAQADAKDDAFVAARQKAGVKVEDTNMG
jgi:hypothetical protein